MALNIWKKNLSALFENGSSLSQVKMPKGLEIFCKKPSLSQVVLQAVKFRNSTGSLNQAIDTVLKYQSKDNHTSIKYENTYQLGPSQKINTLSIQSSINEILNKHFANQKYEPHKIKEFIKVVSDDIKLTIKPHIYHRYKIVVSMTITPNVGQSIVLASRSFWNEDYDDCCTVKFQNKTLCAVAVVFFIYYD